MTSKQWVCEHKIRYASPPDANYSVGPYPCDVCRGWHMSREYRLNAQQRRSDEALEEIARGNVERHIGDACEGEESADSVYDEAYTLGFDALADAGVPHDKAREVARRVAMRFAQP